MKNLLLFITFFLVQVFGFSQEKINGFDSDNQRHGLWSKNYEGTSEIRFSGEFSHGREVGVFKFYDASGSLVAEKVYESNSNTCNAKLYNSKHDLVAEGDFVGKNKNGIWKYFSANKYLIMTETYKNGELEGEKNTYYKNGKVTEQTYYKANKMHGLSVRYTDKGNKISSQTYSKGKLEGVVEYCDASGVVIVKGQYNKGSRVGKWQHFSKGKVVKVEDYDNPRNKS